MERIEAINIMNKYGANKTPFLFIIDFEFENAMILTQEELSNDDTLFSIEGSTNCHTFFNKREKIIFNKYPVSYETYLKAYSKVQKEIHLGNSFLLNLTFPTKIDINLSLKEIFLRSNAKYKLLYKNSFVVFSPECFIKIKDNNIYSFPMKGTIDASIPDAGNIIMNDYKETAEHNTIVDLIRNDISIVSANVKVEKFRFITKVSTNQKDLLQVSSKISGVLPDKYNARLGNILLDLLPAGSVTGAPKKKTVDIIKEVEDYNRGFYTGIFGYFDGKDLNSAVMIRFIENINDSYFYKSGGGITCFSSAEKEYNEMIDKIYVPII